LSATSIDFLSHFRPCSQFLRDEEGLEIPDMLSATLEDILITGKSAEVLAALRKRRILPRNVVDDYEPLPDLLNTFYRDVVSELSGQAREEREEDREGDEEDQEVLEDLGLDEMDPYLALAFKEALTIPKEEKRDPAEKTFFIIGRERADPLLPAPLVLARCLTRLVAVRRRRSCSSLARVILAGGPAFAGLPKHLRSMRRVFSMEAGDLILEFSSELFRRLQTMEDLESSTVTLFLQDCLAR